MIYGIYRSELVFFFSHVSIEFNGDEALPSRSDDQAAGDIYSWYSQYRSTSKCEGGRLLLLVAVLPFFMYLDQQLLMMVEEWLL